jgi:predicted RNase H-like HicB family nuclease
MTQDLFEIPYPTVLRMDRCTDGSFCYIGEHPDLPGCAAHGETIREARESLAHARIAYLKHLVATHAPIPMPSPYRPLDWQAVQGGRTPPSKWDIGESESIVQVA